MGDYTVTPIIFNKSDGSTITAQVKAKNGANGSNGTNGVGIVSAQTGTQTVSGDYTVTPITFNKTDGSTITAEVKAKNGVNGSNGTNGTNGVGILSIESGTVSDAEGYTVTPVVVKKSDGSSTTFEVKAKKGKSISSIEITEGELIISYDDGQSENFGALYGVASADNYGMVKAEEVYISDTLPVRIAEDGKLYTRPATLYSHTVTVKNGESTCMLQVISPKNTKAVDQSTFASVVNSGYHVATGIVNGNTVMGLRRTNTGYYMIDIAGAETLMKYSESTISDVVRTITVAV